MDPVLIDKIISGDSAAEISDFIKDSLFGKSSAKIDAIKPEVASSIFNFHLSVNKKLKQRFQRQENQKNESTRHCNSTCSRNN